MAQHHRIKFSFGYTAGILTGILLTALVLLAHRFSKDETPPAGRICIIIDDFGNALDETTLGFFTLETPITAAVLPGKPYSRQIGQIADSLGYEVMVHMPMEPYDAAEEDSSGYLLTDRLNAAEVDSRVAAAFTELPMAAGMNNHQGSKATTSLQLMKDLARILEKRRKYFIDSFTNPESRAFLTMHRFGVKTEVRQLFLDNQPDREHITAQLDSLALLSRDRGTVIGIGHATKAATLEVLREELPGLQSAGYQFLRASEVVK
ncbi:MAG: divergent polysaccharide deacetylase family protein [FCB group bacterium]|nr:divergent polysaccharide deacetylase family protein [FCB group bacterium]